MASDLKMEIFAYKIFHSFWFEAEQIKTTFRIPEIYGDEFIENIDYDEIYTDNPDIDVVKYGYMMWAMYSDKFVEEFYEKGGWVEFKRQAYPHVYVCRFGVQFDNHLNLRKVREAICNFYHFADAHKNYFIRQKHPIHISKMWIKYHIEYFESYVNIPLSYELSIDAYGAEILLENLKIIFQPVICISKYVDQECNCSQGCNLSSRMPYSELHHDPRKRKTNTGIQRLTFEHEKRIIDKLTDEFSSIDPGFQYQTGKKYPFSEQEVSTFEITNKNENLEFDRSNLTEMELPKQISRIDSTNNLSVEQIFLPVVNRSKQSDTITESSTNVANLENSNSSKSFVNNDEDSKTENFYKGNIEEQDKTAITGQVISINKVQEKASLENWRALKDCSPENENVNSDGKRKMIIKARENLRNEQKDPEIKNFLKMLLVLDDKEEIKFVLPTLQNNGGSNSSQENTNKLKKKSKKKSNRK